MKKLNKMLALIASIGLLTACEVRFYFPWDSRPETTSSANPTSPITSQSQPGNIDSIPTDSDTPSGMIKHGKNLYLQGNEPEPNENLEIYFYQLENSQSQKQSADAFFIKYGDVEVLIDMGTETIGSYAVMPYLKEHNIIEDNTIELAINTHVDKDHIGGFVGNSNGGKYDLGLLRSSYDISVLLDSGYTNDTQLYTRYVSFRDERIAAGMTYYSYSDTMTNDAIPNVFYLGSDTYIQVLDTKLYENNFEDNEIQKSKTEINKDNSEVNIPKIIEQCQKIIKYKPEIFSLWMKNIRIAAILDEFTWQSYSPEANILQLTPDRWHDELELFNPELLFVESAWRGKDKLWKNIIHKKRKHKLQRYQCTLVKIKSYMGSFTQNSVLTFSSLVTIISPLWDFTICCER